MKKEQPKVTHVPWVEKVRVSQSRYFRGLCTCGASFPATTILRDAQRWAAAHPGPSVEQPAS